MFFKDDDTIKVKDSTISTIISSDTTIEGNIISSNSIRLSGSVKGDITSKGLVLVGKGAKVKGNITAESVLVAGSVEGDLNIVNKTNIEPTGEVYGDIVTRRLLIDEESVFSGKCTMIRDDGTPEVREEPGLSKAAEAPAMEDSTEDTGEEISYINVDELRGKRGKKRKR